MKIVVIGAGSVGAHVAYRLAAEGAEVTVLDASRPGGGTSASSIAWLSEFPQMSWEEEPGKAKLRRQVHQLFADVAAEVPGDYVQWCGTLLWGTPEEREPYREAADRVRAEGRDVRVITGAEARVLDPALHVAEDEVVFHEPESGWVDGPAIVAALLAAVEARGGTVLTGARVVSLERGDDRVVAAVLENGMRIEADGFVNAAGSWASHIAAMADLAIPLDLVPGRVLYTNPFPDDAAPRHIINAPAWCGRPDPSGGFAIHYRGGPQEPGHGANIRSEDELLAEVAEALPVVAEVGIARSSIGIRPIPPGGPVVGAVPWLPNFYFTVSHGGIGWGPMWGWAAARELLQGETMAELAAMRPTRFYLEPIAIGRFADDAEQVSR